MVLISMAWRLIVNSLECSPMVCMPAVIFSDSKNIIISAELHPPAAVRCLFLIQLMIEGNWHVVYKNGEGRYANDKIIR